MSLGNFDYMENCIVCASICTLIPARILWNLYHSFISAMSLTLKERSDQIFVTRYVPWKNQLQNDV